MFHKEDLGHERGVDANAFLPIINNNFPLKVNPQTFGVRQTDKKKEMSKEDDFLEICWMKEMRAFIFKSTSTDNLET